MEMESRRPANRSPLTRLNMFMAKNRVGKQFKLAERNTTFTTELRAGTATFLTMAYILAVNASILSDSGATCSVSDCIPLCSDSTVSAAKSIMVHLPTIRKQVWRQIINRHRRRVHQPTLLRPSTTTSNPGRRSTTTTCKLASSATATSLFFLLQRQPLIRSIRKRRCNPQISTRPCETMTVPGAEVLPRGRRVATSIAPSLGSSLCSLSSSSSRGCFKS
ncbi:hypothetical protein CsSME_00046899 [Camellia sinensis var. sinensis]